MEIPIENPSFEEPGAGEGSGIPRAWEPCVIGPALSISLDPEVKKSGKSSVRISSREPTDAALQQHVCVHPGRFYLLKGWVQTRDLVPAASSDVHGTLAVMSPGHAGEGHLIAAGRSLAGTHGWTHIRVPFEAPSEGSVRVLCFLCGWGKGTGTAWFDGLEIVPAGELPANILVTSEELVSKPVNPLIYGNFIESGLGHQVDRMWSELLFNRSFEEITPYKRPMWDWLSRGPGDDLSKEDWWHSGYEENHWYLAAGNPEARLEYLPYWDFHHGFQSASIVNKSPSKPALLAQDGIFVKRGISYLFSGSLRTGEMARRGGPQIRVTLSLYPGRDFSWPVAEAKIDGVGSAWKTFSAVLPNSGFEGRATFALSVPPQADLRADGLSLKPSDNVHGWRKEIIEALHRVRPSIIRFPGGCFASFYNFRDGIGPEPERRPRESEFWGGLENNDAGTAEFVTLCRLVGAEPFLCVNVMTAGAAEAADWVAYCNAGASHPMGEVRKVHGFPEPFAVKYWELDNETYRKFAPLEYAGRCVEFARAMKAVDPKIQLVMVGYWRFHDFLAEMLEVAGKDIDLVTDRGLDESYLRKVLKIIEEYNRKSGRQIRLCNTEWLPPWTDVPVIPDALNRQPSSSELTLQNRQIRWRYAMNAARQLLVFQRLGGDFAFSNFNNMANTWGQNVIECAKEGVYLSAAGRVFELLSSSPAAWPLRLEGMEDTPGLVCQAAWDSGRNALVLIALNYRGAKAPITFDFTPIGFKPRDAHVSILRAASPASFNSLKEPDAIFREDSRIELDPAERFLLTPPAYSIMHAVLR